MLGIAAPQASAVSSTTCFDGQRFPKVIQGTEEEKNSHAGAITVYNDEAVFSAGLVKGSDFEISSSVSDKYIHVGRINIDNRQWAWHKQFAEEEKKMKTVSGLAVDSTGSQLAVHAC